MSIILKEESPAGQERQSVNLNIKYKMVPNLGWTHAVFPGLTIALKT